MAYELYRMTVMGDNFSVVETYLVFRRNKSCGSAVQLKLASSLSAQDLLPPVFALSTSILSRNATCACSLFARASFACEELVSAILLKCGYEFMSSMAIAYPSLISRSSTFSLITFYFCFNMAILSLYCTVPSQGGCCPLLAPAMVSKTSKTAATPIFVFEWVQGPF